MFSHSAEIDIIPVNASIVAAAISIMYSGVPGVFAGIVLVVGAFFEDVVLGESVGVGEGVGNFVWGMLDG